MCVCVWRARVLVCAYVLNGVSLPMVVSQRRAYILTYSCIFVFITVLGMRGEAVSACLRACLRMENANPEPESAARTARRIHGRVAFVGLAGMAVRCTSDDTNCLSDKQSNI